MNGSLYKTEMGKKARTINSVRYWMLLSIDHKVRQWSDRKKKVEVPLLIPMYLFS
jgi:hypothetical protein